MAGNNGKETTGGTGSKRKKSPISESEELSSILQANGSNDSAMARRSQDPTVVQLTRTESKPVEDEALWAFIRNRTNAISFSQYSGFINRVMCEGQYEDDTKNYGLPSLENRNRELRNRNTIYGTDAYKLLKLATEAFLIAQCGIEDETDDSENVENTFTMQQYLGEDAEGNVNDKLPYFRRILKQIAGEGSEQQEGSPYCESFLNDRLTCPIFIELIWSYWHEEAMLVQTMNAISMRFQNKRSRPGDPLANLALDPLRPLNNLFWGYIQDENNRLSIKRRAYEYDHQYGFSLVGKAVNDLNPIDSRTKFIEAFHTLLHYVSLFYREDDDVTIVADAFKLLNALREVHLILSEGAHNQYGDLPWTARKEMLMMQWMLARPEMKEFLRGRYMTPYQETWMGAVDDMKRLQGWSDVTVTHYHELAIFGEQILLSIRFGDWIVINKQDHAKEWAREWRPEIQRYIHAYKAVSGVDLSVEISDVKLARDRFVQPSLLMSRRLNKGAGQKRLVNNRS